MRQPPLPSQIQSYEKEKEQPFVGSFAWFQRGNSPPTLPESEAHESNRVLRGRALRVNTLHQRVYHSQDLSPLTYPPDDYASRSDLLATTEIDIDKDFLLQQSPPLLPSPSKPRFLPNSHVSRSPIGYLLRKVISLPDSPQAWLGLYFVLNLTLTLYNKSVLIHFPFPYTLTAIHALCGTIGTFVLLRLESTENGTRPGSRLMAPNPMPNLSGKELIVLFLFSILYTVNIIVSNASLRLVTVPFHQVVRASTPFFTIMFAAVLLGRRCSRRKLLSLIPVVAGVGFATYGDYYFTAFGFFLTLLGTLLAALKTTLTNVILVKPTTSTLPVSSESNYPLPDESTGTQSAFPPNFFSALAALAMNHMFPPSPSSSPAYPTKPLSPAAPPLSAPLSLPKLTLSPLHLLYLLSPLAFIQTMLLAHYTGELDRVRWHLFNSASEAAGLDTGAASKNNLWLILNGVLAFFLNVVSFNANRRVGPLAMSVAANVKQVLTILCAVTIFDLTITLANGVGIALTLLGGALYAAVELREKEDRKSRVG
ncbi:triose-phosphate transporter family-domain-containing protein [Pholiota molesta]|nr:triose-phosphate transporter family-domain-containing protein [Pholiota molesta]